MIRFGVIGLAVLAAVAAVLASIHSLWWIFAAAPLAAAAVTGVHDLVQKDHSILRNYPVIGHARFLMEALRPELQQYFIERNYDGRPFDRDTRTVIYERAKGIHGEHAFGTEREVNEVGYEYLVHSACPKPQLDTPPKVRIGGPDCTKPYDMALFNVSAMSFGALSGNAIEALNRGAAMGGFAHDTGEGAISEHHLHGGDLIWEIGSGYFGARTADGDFDPEKFRDKAALDAVKMVSLKLSQGAKPGIGGVLPGAKVTPEIAAARDVPVGQTVISPPYHRVFHSPRDLVRFVARMRELSGGKPAGFKLCIGSRTEFLAICKAMVDEGTTPDFIIVDGSEGGTGAAPLEFEDNVGVPLTEGLVFVHNALVGAGVRDKVKLGAAGKVATGTDIVKRLIQGADYCNAARAMMMAVGCIQAQRCHTNTCPVGVATQDPRRARALDVPDKAERVFRYQQGTVRQALQLIAAMGLDDPGKLKPAMLKRRLDHVTTKGYDEIFTWLQPGELLAGAPHDWARRWAVADPDAFEPGVAL